MKRLLRAKSYIAVFTAALSLVNVAGAAIGPLVVWGGGQQGVPANLGNVTAISSALGHSLAIKSDGTVVAWGQNFDGQCNVPAGLKAKAVAAGAFFSVGVKDDGTVVAWGDDQWDQCRIPARLANVTAVSAGRAHTLALRSDGTVAAWGSNLYGQTDVPASVTSARQVVARWNYSMALRADGTVVAWGVNDVGQTTIPAGLNNVVYIDGNESYALAVRSNGSVVSWGQGPAVPDWANNVVAVAAGDDHVLALRADGSIITWGGNDAGQLTAPSGLKAQAVSAGWRHSLAIGATATTSKLLLFNPRVGPQGFSVSFDSSAGSSYALEYKDGINPQWTSLPSQTAPGQLMDLTDPSPRSGYRLYRLRKD